MGNALNSILLAYLRAEGTAARLQLDHVPGRRVHEADLAGQGPLSAAVHRGRGGRPPRRRVGAARHHDVTAVGVDAVRGRAGVVEERHLAGGARGHARVGEGGGRAVGAHHHGGGRAEAVHGLDALKRKREKSYIGKD